MSQITPVKQPDAPLSVLVVSETKSNYLISLELDAMMGGEVQINQTHDTLITMGFNHARSEAHSPSQRRVTLEAEGLQSAFRAFLREGKLFLILPKAESHQAPKPLE